MIKFDNWFKRVLEEKKFEEWHNWKVSAGEAFAVWAEEQRKDAIQKKLEKEDGCWTEWDERLFQKWVDKEKERYEDKQWEKFVDWFEDHFGNGSNWQEKMYELFEEKGLYTFYNGGQ